MNVPSVMGKAGLYHAVLPGTPGAGLPPRFRRPGGCYNRARMTMIDRVQAFIERHHLLKPGQELLVGVSGGADSQCLLHVLVSLGYRPIVAYYDHGLRPNSRDEAQFVAGLAARLDCKFVPGSAPPGALAEQPDGSIEAAARRARYRFFAAAAVENSVNTIATGHTADDQAETVLLHLLRGTGPAGLRGMLPATDLEAWRMLPGGNGLRLVRPLLSESHAAAVDYCEEHGLSIQDDPTNLDLRFTRNRIRHELLPWMESFNPRFRMALNRLAAIIVDDVALIEDQVDQARSDVVTGSRAGRIELSVPAFTRVPPAVQRSMLRRIAAELTGADIECSMEQVERLREYALDSSRPRALQFSGLIRAEDAGSKILLTHSGEYDAAALYPQTIEDKPTRIAVPGILALQAGWQLCSSLQQPGEDLAGWLESGWPNRVVLNADLAASELTLRNRAPGDRLRLFGSAGTQKIADLMIDRKVPLQARALWPLVAAGDEIIWVPGLARSDFGSISGEPSKALVMEIVPPSADGQPLHLTVDRG
jgi:tRNA(Ile)-lysidine synthetase-like protein